jgi:hypothetical protein
MKRVFIVLVAICTIGISVSHAQEMKKGMSLFNVGLGFVPGIGVNASYDFGLVDKWGPGIFTIGGYVGYETWGKTYSGFGDYRVNAFAFAPRATYRYAINKSFEVYGASMLGAIVYSYSKDYNDDSGNVFFTVVAGCRYSFSNSMAVFAEVGYNDLSYLNGGLSFAF